MWSHLHPKSTQVSLHWYFHLKIICIFSIIFQCHIHKSHELFRTEYRMNLLHRNMNSSTHVTIPWTLPELSGGSTKFVHAQLLAVDQSLFATDQWVLWMGSDTFTPVEEKDCLMALPSPASIWQSLEGWPVRLMLQRGRFGVAMAMKNW